VLKRAFKGIWKFACIAEVDNQEVASAEIMVAPETKGPVKAAAAAGASASAAGEAAPAAGEAAPAAGEDG
jgi:hypothetical protein